MSFAIGSTGIWLCETTAPHSFDRPLADWLYKFFDSEGVESILDLGCGSCDYVDYLASNRAFQWVRGIDGNPKTKDFCPLCTEADISKPCHFEIDGKVADWVMSLEVGEHIPLEFEQTFLDNVAGNGSEGVILSWFPRYGHGIGHVNPRPNDWVKAQMHERGFISDKKGEMELREAASLWWFKESLMVFRAL